MSLKIFECRHQRLLRCWEMLSVLIREPLVNMDVSFFYALLYHHHPNPIERLYVYQHNRSLDIGAMRECAKIFLGEHDFASFCVFNGLGDTIRVIETIDIQEKDGIVTMRFDVSQ